VRRLGTIAMSSNPYARRPDLPIPISTSTCPPELRIRYPGALPRRFEDIAAPAPGCAPGSVLVVRQLVGGRRGRVGCMLGPRVARDRGARRCRRRRASCVPTRSGPLRSPSAPSPTPRTSTPRSCSETCSARMSPNASPTTPALGSRMR
jgi:hypothetical protein